MTTELFKKGDFERIYQKMSSDKPLFEVLTDCYRSGSTTEWQAAEMAKETIMEVAKYKNLEERLNNGESAEILHEFLSTLGDRENDENARMQMLHQLNAGLICYQSEDMVIRLEKGENVQTFYEEYLQNPAYANLTEDALRASVEERMGCYHISERNMDELIKLLQKSEVVHYTGALVGKNANRFRCIVAACIYKNSNGKISIPEAVVLASTAIEIEDIANAAGRGIIAKEKAKKVIGIILAVACVALIGYLLYGGGLLSVGVAIGEQAIRLSAAFAEMQWFNLAHVVVDLGQLGFDVIRRLPIVASVVSIVLVSVLGKTTYDKLVDFVGEKTAKLVYLDDESCMEESFIAKGFEKIKNCAAEKISAIRRHTVAEETTDEVVCMAEEAEVEMA